MVAVQLATLLACAFSAPRSNVVVQTTHGPVEGTAAQGAKCSSFYGVPYAAPPLGPLRFAPPSKVTAWTTPRPAFQPAKSCLQTFGDSFVNLPLPVEELFEKFHIAMEPMAEDCLYLNVFTPPRKDNSSLPVMVWFHGGSYMGGSGDLQSGVAFYDGHHLCADGDVVVVTVNYRLGIFGFLALDELRNESGTAGNMGIQDQRLALQWVQANAAAFGGDASRVTIFGESAGAASVVTHLTAERSQNLFSAGIMESGGLWLRSFRKAQGETMELAAATGCAGAASVLACMRALDGLALLHKQLQSGWTDTGPCADGFEYAVGETERSVLLSGKVTRACSSRNASCQQAVSCRLSPTTTSIAHVVTLAPTAPKRPACVPHDCVPARGSIRPSPSSSART